MNITNPGKYSLSVLLALSLSTPSLVFAESGAFASSSGPDGTVNTVRSYNPGPGYSYSYSPARPQTVTPEYPAQPYAYRSGPDYYRNRGYQRAYGQDSWSGSNRLNYWNDVINDMVTDMFGDGAGDFDVDMKIRFKAKGTGKGRGEGTARSSASQQYLGDYRGDVRNQGYYDGRADGRQNYRYRDSSYPPYPSYPYPYAPYRP